MYQYILGLFDWTVWLVLILVALFVIWLFFGGGDYPLIGYRDLEVPEQQSIPKAHRRGDYSDESYSGESSGDLVSPLKYIRQLREQPSANVDVSFGSVNTEQPREEFIPDPTQIKNTKSSRKEELCRTILQNIYGKPFPSVRPDWLRNPETGFCLELDCYNEELGIALEYNGEQHYIWPNFTKQTQEEFLQQARRDKLKVEICDQKGVYLITVPYTIPESYLERYIQNLLPKDDN